jgi:hypothetical protein
MTVDGEDAGNLGAMEKINFGDVKEGREVLIDRRRRRDV